MPSVKKVHADNGDNDTACCRTPDTSDVGALLRAMIAAEPGLKTIHHDAPEATLTSLTEVLSFPSTAQLAGWKTLLLLIRHTCKRQSCRQRTVHCLCLIADRA